MAIINYYEKYGISQTDELEKIQWVINQKITDEENDSFGEGHSDKMFFLESAKEAFATAESRAKYDQELTDSMKKKDPDGERKASFNKWYSDAVQYRDNKQYDLAKSAVDRAFQYMTPELGDSAFYCFAAEAYSRTDNHSQALEYANQAIILAPESQSGYLGKVCVLDRYIHAKNLDYDKEEEIYNQLVTTCKLLIEKALKNNDAYNAAQGYAMLAKMNYVYADQSAYSVTGRNNSAAEDYAQKSVSLGYEIPIAREVLDDIAKRHAKVAELEQQNVNLGAELKKKNDALKAESKKKNDALKAESKKKSNALKAELKKKNDVLKSKNIRLNAEISSLKGGISDAKDRTSDQMCFFPSSMLGFILPVCIFNAVAGLIIFIVGAAIRDGDTVFVGFIFLAVGGMPLIARGIYVASSKNIHSAWDSIRGKEAAIFQNEDQIRDNENNTNNTIKNNEYDTNNTIENDEHDTNNIIKNNEYHANNTIKNNESMILQYKCEKAQGSKDD